jgi:hypothetical protein
LRAGGTGEDPRHERAGKNSAVPHGLLLSGGLLTAAADWPLPR